MASIYRARGETEIRIEEQQLDLFAGATASPPAPAKFARYGPAK